MGRKLALSEAEGVAELRYLPFGETRWAWGVTPTDRRYTGQRELAGVGLYDYNARMYWPAAGRFISADTVVPDPHNPQQFNRYAYVVNNPLKHTDPTGHAPQRQDSDRCLRRNCQPYVEAGGNIVFDPRSGQYVNHGAPHYIPPSRQLPAPRSASAPRLPAPKLTHSTGSPPQALPRSTVRWTQSSASERFGPRGPVANRSVFEVAEDVKSGKIAPDTLPVRVFQKTPEMNSWPAKTHEKGYAGSFTNLEDGAIYAINNRSLTVHTLAGTEQIPVRWASVEEVLKFSYEYTTPNLGVSIVMRESGTVVSLGGIISFPLP